MGFRGVAASIVSCVLFFSGCGSILIRPAADNVQTIALVSVFMNREFYDVKTPQSGVNLASLKPLAAAVIKGAEIPKEIADKRDVEYEQIISHGITAYTEKLEGLGNWKWVPAASVVSNDAYREFAASLAGKDPSPKLLQAAKTINRSEWYVAKGMVRIPLNSVINNGNKTITVGGVNEDMRPALARLCKDLRVDAVALLEFDMAYKKPFSDVGIMGGLFAIPSVRSALVVVNKDGEIAANSGLITRGQGKRFDGKGLKMMGPDHVNLDDKTIDSYCLAIDKSADAVKKRLASEFGGK